MLQRSDTRYARAGDFSVAFQVVGDGPVDLVLAPGFISHLDLLWGDPDWARSVERLASFSRLILFDKRGTGLSDPTPAVPTLEERVDDLRAVMDAAGSRQAALFGYSEGAAMSLLFAATCPERVSALVLFGSLISGVPEPGTVPWAAPCARAYDELSDVVAHWGEGRLLSFMAPSLPRSEVGRRLTGVFERTAASPAMAAALLAGMRRLDLGDILPTIDRPTLVLHRADDPFPVEAARDIARQIPGARYVEHEGADHWWWVGDVDRVVGDVEEFLTGVRPAPVSDRVLSTVMFSDIVGSTEVASRLGDAAWRELLGRHDELVGDEVTRFRGRAVKSTGDGLLATFDGPARAVQCAHAISEGAAGLGLRIRAGLHTGECEVMGEDIGGIAVHIAARVASEAGPGETLVSSTVRDLVVGSDLVFADRGEHALKGVPGQWRLFAATTADAGAAGGAPALDEPDPPTAFQRAVAAVGTRQPGLTKRLVAVTRGRRGSAQRR